MKKWISFIAVYIGLCNFVLAQKFCYVDTEYILENLPEYTKSQDRLKSQSELWQKELEQKQEDLTKKQQAFEVEKILLTTEQIKEKEAKLNEEAKAIKELQEKRYGPNGDLIAMRRSLVKSIQDQVYNATKKVADKRGYSFVFDKGSDLIMIYTDPKFDISREVLNVLTGKETIAPTTNKKTTNKRSK